MPKLTLSLLTSAAAMVAVISPGAAALGATVRFEAESTGAVKDKNDAVGYDSLSGVMGRGGDASASNGEVLYTLGMDRKIKIVFAGTGIDLIAPTTNDGAQFKWTLNEGVQTGLGTTIGAGGPQSVIPIISGLPNGLHTLEIEKANNVDFVLRMDAFDVHDSGERVRYEETDPAIVYSPGAWALGDTGGNAAQEASGGSIGYTIVQGATATLQFTGTGVAANIVSRLDGLAFSYDIDGVVTGTIDTSAEASRVSAGFWHRYPFLLANDLTNGPHTLTLTAIGGAVGGVDFIGILDSIDVFQPAVPEPATAALVTIALSAITVANRRS